MKEFIEFLVKGIVDNLEAVDIQMTESEYGYITITIKVADGDMGKVIGSNGRVINAIRRLAKAKAVKMGRRVQIQLYEPEGFRRAPEETPEE